jgi:cytochrome-b5 reductase
MFARTAFPTLRGATRAVPLKQNVRRYTTPAEPKKSSPGLLYATILGAVVAGGAYYYYSTTTNVKPLPPPEITLKGDGAWIDLPLVEIHPVTGNTKLLRFALPTENHISGLHVASAILTKYKGPNDEKPTIRPYTPVNDEDARGFLDLLVKKALFLNTNGLPTNTITSP